MQVSQGLNFFWGGNIRFLSLLQSVLLMLNKQFGIWLMKNANIHDFPRIFHDLQAFQKVQIFQAPYFNFMLPGSGTIQTFL
jgi:muramoyltetrapeptide carboxypeptidase LdcA involved in peptidoglycan recycling